MIYSWKKIVKTGLPLLTLTILIEIFGGQVLQGKRPSTERGAGRTVARDLQRGGDEEGAMAGAQARRGRGGRHLDPSEQDHGISGRLPHLGEAVQGGLGLLQRSGVDHRAQAPPAGGSLSRHPDPTR